MKHTVSTRQIGEVLHGDHVVVDVDKKKRQLTFKVAKRVGEPVAAVK